LKKTCVAIVALAIAALLSGCAEPAAVFHDAAHVEHYEAHHEHREELLGGTKAVDPATSSIRFELLNHDEVKAIALRHVGVTEDAVTHMEIELDYDDDGKYWEYEIDFHAGATEYDVVIDALNGTVLMVETERENR